MKLSEEAQKELILTLLGVNKPEKVQDSKGGWKIVVLQRGWVAVGEYYRDGYECRLENASVIRRWGTTKGLGELAINGPLEDTKLDKSGTIEFHLGAEVCRLNCKTTNWN